MPNRLHRERHRHDGQIRCGFVSALYRSLPHRALCRHHGAFPRGVLVRWRKLALDAPILGAADNDCRDRIGL